MPESKLREVPINRFHQPSYYQPQLHPPTWWHYWPVSSSAPLYPAPHGTPFFNPRAYDTVAPWAFETPPISQPYRYGHGPALSLIEREMLSEKYHMEQLFNDRHLSPTELMLCPSRPASLLEHYSIMNPIRIDDKGNCWLNCYFDLRSYRPEEINVVLNSKEHYLSVEAAHEVTEAKEHYVKRHYLRKVYIPEDYRKIDLSSAQPKSYLTTEGILCVEAPLPKLSPEEFSRLKSPSICMAATMPPINAFTVFVKVV